MTGRHTGTGSANIGKISTYPSHLGYAEIPLLSLLSCTGSLPPTNIPPQYTSLRAARSASTRPACLLAEGTTSNGRSLLRIPLKLQTSDFEGSITWLLYIRHHPSDYSGSDTCPMGPPLRHLVLRTLWTAVPWRKMSVRVLHPSGSPSSPSWSVAEALGGQTGTMAEAVASVIAETGRVRRVGIGWVEKKGFIEYWEKTERRS